MESKRGWSFAACSCSLVLFARISMAHQAVELPPAANTGQNTAPVASDNQATAPTPPTEAEILEDAEGGLEKAAEALEDIAYERFDAFTIEWMRKLAATENFQRTERVRVTETPDGFVAEYTGYLPHRYITVKRTRSKETPFVGILTYREKILQSTGKTREEALNGPFTQVKTRQISEIFRYTRGEWLY